MRTAKKVHRRIMIIISECSLLINCVHNNSRLSCIYNIYSIYKHEIASAHWPKQFCVAAAHTRCIEYNITKLSSVFALDAKKKSTERASFFRPSLCECVYCFTCLVLKYYIFRNCSRHSTDHRSHHPFDIPLNCCCCCTTANNNKNSNYYFLAARKWEIWKINRF